MGRREHHNSRMGPHTTIAIEKPHAKELELLRLAWDLKTLSDVIGELLRRYRYEEIKALGIKEEGA